MRLSNLKKIKFINFNRKKKTTETIYLFGERVSSSIGRTLVACFGILGFFYSAPILINFVDQEIFSFLFSIYSENNGVQAEWKRRPNFNRYK